MKTIAVNLGCGTDLRDSTDDITMFNFDLTPPYDIGGDIVHLPFKEGSIRHAICYNILEHIQDLRLVKQELARVLEPYNGQVHILVPHYTSPDAWGDDTHCRCFSHHSFFSYHWPGFAPLRVEKVKPKVNKDSIPLPGMELADDEDSAMWLKAVMGRLNYPYEKVKRAYEKGHMKVGCGDWEKSNVHTMYA
jgi:hypothetical protein